MDDTDEPEAADDGLTRARERLYGGPPEEFMAVRTRLSREARSAGDAAAAKTIAALRKPTLSASVVNRHVLQDASVLAELESLGDRLRAAQANLDAPAMRELTTERRTTIARLTEAALAATVGGDVSTSVRDEVRATLDAAVADPGIAARLGTLVRPESFSGFGTSVPTTPELTLVRGGRTRTEPEASDRADRRVPAATRRALQRQLDKARRALTDTERTLVDAENAERDSAQQVTELADALAELQGRLAEAKDAHHRDQQALTGARSARRRARSALDRAEREADV